MHPDAHRPAGHQRNRAALARWRASPARRLRQPRRDFGLPVTNKAAENSRLHRRPGQLPPAARRTHRACADRISNTWRSYPSTPPHRRRALRIVNCETQSTPHSTMRGRINHAHELHESHISDGAFTTPTWLERPRCPIAIAAGEHKNTHHTRSRDDPIPASAARRMARRAVVERCRFHRLANTSNIAISHTDKLRSASLSTNVRQQSHAPPRRTTTWPPRRFAEQRHRSRTPQPRGFETGEPSPISRDTAGSHPRQASRRAGSCP